MNLQPSNPETWAGQQEFLRNSVGTEYKTGGGTIDNTAFANVAVDGYIKAGTAVYKNANGFYVPWTDAAEGETREGAGLNAHDVKLIDGSNAIIGVLVAGHPLEDKCIGVTEGFKEAVRGYLRFDA